jgi:hypothetical protein
LSFNEKVEKKESSYGANNQQSYGTNQQSYGDNQQSYDGESQGNNYNTGGNSYGQASSPAAYGSGPYRSKRNSGGYGSSAPSYDQNRQQGGGYEERSSYKKEKTHFVRKVTRQYCRYAAAWSEKACKFCCKVVARSAYTNPDDIVAAIFSFDPADPASGGAGIERYHDKPNEYEKSEKPKYEENREGYGQAQGYNAQSEYESGGNSYGQAPSQASYGQAPYRSKRNSEYSAAPTYGSSAPVQSYSQPVDQYQPQGDQYSATPEAYSTKPDYGNEYENNAKAIKQCVCCAPKQRYYK